MKRKDITRDLKTPRRSNWNVFRLEPCDLQASQSPVEYRHGEARGFEGGVRQSLRNPDADSEVS